MTDSPDFTIYNVTGEYGPGAQPFVTFTFGRKVIAHTEGYVMGAVPLETRDDVESREVDDLGRPLESVPEGSTIPCGRCFRPTSFAAGCCVFCGALN